MECMQKIDVCGATNVELEGADFGKSKTNVLYRSSEL